MLIDENSGIRLERAVCWGREGWKSQSSVTNNDSPRSQSSSHVKTAQRQKKKWLGIMEKRLRRDEQTKTMAPKTKSPTAALFLHNTANHNILIQSQKGHDTINPLQTRRLRSHGNSWATSEEAWRVAKKQPLFCWKQSPPPTGGKCFITPRLQFMIHLCL